MSYPQSYTSLRFINHYYSSRNPEYHPSTAHDGMRGLGRWFCKIRLRSRYQEYNQNCCMRGCWIGHCASTFLHCLDAGEVDTSRASKEGDNFDWKGSQEESCWTYREGYVDAG